MWSLESLKYEFNGTLTNDASSDSSSAINELNQVDFGDIKLTNGSVFYDMNHACLFRYDEENDTWIYQYKE